MSEKNVDNNSNNEKENNNKSYTNKEDEEINYKADLRIDISSNNGTSHNDNNDSNGDDNNNNNNDNENNNDNANNEKDADEDLASLTSRSEEELAELFGERRKRFCSFYDSPTSGEDEVLYDGYEEHLGNDNVSTARKGKTPRRKSGWFIHSLINSFIHSLLSTNVLSGSGTIKIKIIRLFKRSCL